jgi:hypothetical protein
MNMEYVIVTSIPVFTINNEQYILDNWAKDIGGQKNLWEKITIISPIKVGVEKSPNLIKLPDGISFITFNNVFNLIIILKNLINSKDSIFEFAGTSNHGILGFIVSKLLKRDASLFITFDGPLELALIYYKKFTLKKILVILLLKAHKIFRKWVARSSKGVIVIGDGIINEFDPQKKYKDNYLTIPLTLFDENIFFRKKQSPENLIKIACADNMNDEKSVLELLNALNNLKNSLDKPWELHLFGDGPLLETNKKFDKEYSCTWSLEQMYLKENGINYTFVKPIDGITTWKYTKNTELFETLSKFYKQINK